MKKISTERLAELLKAEYKLDLLEAGGVDNWDGYDVSLSCEYDDETESYFDFKKKSDEEITSEFEDVRVTNYPLLGNRERVKRRE